MLLVIRYRSRLAYGDTPISVGEGFVLVSILYRSLFGNGMARTQALYPLGGSDLKNKTKRKAMIDLIGEAFLLLLF